MQQENKSKKMRLIISKNIGKVFFPTEIRPIKKHQTQRKVSSQELNEKKTKEISNVTLRSIIERHPEYIEGYKK